MTLFVDLSSWEGLSVTGEDRVRFLNGMCTGNVTSMEPGQWLRTCLLSAKGRVLSVFDLLFLPESLFLLCEPSLVAPTEEVLKKHAIIDDVVFSRAQKSMHRVWSTPASVWTAVPVMEACPAPQATEGEVEIMRVEAGWPKYGVDVSEKSFPFESPLAAFIDYEKGCYVGQEPVARVHARGGAQKFLRGIVLEGAGPAARGASIDSELKAGAGTVTSSVVSPTHGPIALGYVHQKAGGPGAEVSVDGRKAKLVELPFGNAG